ncbi:MAG: nitrile hydratase [Alphaproteobacteria bacterium]|nr:nitrile hydratase [Alphaproteobacteria bacterium]
MDPRYQPGDRVRVLHRNQPGHVRTPIYVRGKTGVIERVVGPFPNPELLAVGHSGLPYKILYRVNFKQGDLWDDYEGTIDDTLEIEIYEHWLAPV